MITTIFMEITNYCSKYCKHCFNSAYRNNPQFMKIDEIDAILNIIKPIGIKQLKIVGGEPLEHPDFKRVLRRLEEAKIPYIIVTDSIKITNFISQLQKSLYLKQIRVSIDGTETVHDYIREPGDYLKVIEVVKLLRAEEINVSLNYTINKLNYHHIEEVWDLSKRLNVSLFFGVVKHCNNLLNEEELVFSESETIDLIKQINLYKSYNNELYNQIWKNLYDDEEFIAFQKEMNIEQHIGCYAGQRSFVIDVVGDIWPCVLLKGFSNFGNILKDDFEMLWKNMNQKMSNLKRNFSECESCVYSQKCTGGCRGNAYYFGDIQGKDPNCYLYTNTLM